MHTKSSCMVKISLFLYIIGRFSGHSLVYMSGSLTHKNSVKGGKQGRIEMARIEKWTTNCEREGGWGWLNKSFVCSEPLPI